MKEKMIKEIKMNCAVLDCCCCCSDTVTKYTVQMGFYLFMIFEIFRDSFRIYEWISSLYFSCVCIYPFAHAVVHFFQF